jgi:hypothetical protein
MLKYSIHQDIFLLKQGSRLHAKLEAL